MKYSFIYIYIALILISCNSYVESNNDPNDVLDGNRDKIYKMCTDSSSVEDFKSLFHLKDSILGKMVKFEIINVNTTNVKSKGASQVTYSIKLKVKYQNGSNEESVEFVKNNLEIKF